MTHRLYVDEVGTAAFPLTNNANERYLTLAGVVVELEHMAAFVAPELESLKSEFFGEHHSATDPLIFHRKDVMRGKHPFDVLWRAPAVRKRFDAKLLSLLQRAQFTLLLVIIDKAAHYKQYLKPFPPYHYCMSALLERYVAWLDLRRLTGDVVAESRGKREDRELRRHFEEAVQNGTNWPRQTMQRILSSHTLRIAKKTENEAGLQIADLIAYPCFKRALARKLRKDLPTGFGAEIAEAMVPKLRRSASGDILGHGLKWLP